MDKRHTRPQIEAMRSLCKQGSFILWGTAMDGGSRPNGPGADTPDSDSGTQTLTRPETRSQVKKPSLYKVVLLNDDFTPMDFVVSVLKTLFEKTDSEAVEIMLRVHHDGKAAAGTYPLDVAEMKALQVHGYAQKNKYPLKCTIEKEG